MLGEKNGKPERVAVYCRVSSDEQAEAGTIQNQLEFGRRYTDLHGLPVHDYYLDDGISGTLPIEARPSGARLMADARAGRFNVVLVYKLDRFARRLKVLMDSFETLDALSIGLRSMTQPFDTATPIGRLFMQMMGSFAEYERETILERTAQGRSRAVREGRWTGGITPFGYRLEGTDHNRRLAVNDAEAQVVRRVFEEYVNNRLGLDRVADLFNAEQIPTPWLMRGIETKRWPGMQYRWSCSTVRDILVNTAYVGRYRAYRHAARPEEEVPCPPIVGEAIFSTARRELGERLIEATRNARRFYLLRGLVRCYCEKHPVMIGRNSTTRSKRYPYYTCPECGRSVPADKLEREVWQDVDGFIHNPGEPLAKLRGQLSVDAGSENLLRAEIATVEGKINDLKEQQLTYARQNGRRVLSDAAFDRLMVEADGDIEALEAKKQVIFQRLETAQASQAALLSAEALLAQLHERAENPDDATRRDLVKLLVTGIKARPDGPPIVTYCFDEPADPVADRLVNALPFTK